MQPADESSLSHIFVVGRIKRIFMYRNFFFVVNDASSNLLIPLPKESSLEGIHLFFSGTELVAPLKCCNVRSFAIDRLCSFPDWILKIALLK